MFDVYDIDEVRELLKSGGPYIGPRGGKWADPQHTIPWREESHGGGHGAEGDHGYAPPPDVARDFARSFAALTRSNDGHWKSEKQARFLLERLEGVRDPKVESWAKKHGISGDVITFVASKHLEGSGVRDVSRRRYVGNVFVVDSGGVVAIGKPKFDHVTAQPKWDREVELVWKREKEPTLRVDPAAEKRAKAEKNRPEIEKIRALPAYREAGSILRDFVRQLEDGRELSIKQKAILQKYTDEVGDYKGSTREAFHTYKRALGTVIREMGQALHEHGHMDGVLEETEVAAKAAEEHGAATERKHGWWIDKAAWVLLEHAKRGIPSAGSTSEDIVEQIEKMLRAKKLSKRGSKFIDAVQTIAKRVDSLGEEGLRKLARDEIGPPKPPVVDPFAIFDEPIEKAYKLQGETEVHGLDIAIENRKGSKRRWKDPETGEEGATVMVYPYGYIRGVKGADGDEVDVFVGPHRESRFVFVVNQRQMADKRKFDEHKVMLGFRTEDEARAAYLKHYDAHGPQLLGSMRVWSIDRFKRWLEEGDKNMPAAKMGGGPYVGPRGGLWADPQHTIPWDAKKHGKVTPGNCPRCKGLAHIVSRQTAIGGEDQVSSAPCRTCNKGGKIPFDPAKAKKLGLPVPPAPKRAETAPAEKQQPQQLSLLSYKPPAEQLALVRAESLIVPLGKR